MLLKIRVHAAARRRPRLLRTGGDIWYDREVVVPDGNQSTIVLDVDGQPGNKSQHCHFGVPTPCRGSLSKPSGGRNSPAGQEARTTAVDTLHTIWGNNLTVISYSNKSGTGHEMLKSQTVLSSGAVIRTKTDFSSPSMVSVTVRDPDTRPPVVKMTSPS